MSFVGETMSWERFQKIIIGVYQWIKKEANDNKGVRLEDNYYAFRSRGGDDLKLFSVDADAIYGVLSRQHTHRAP